MVSKIKINGSDGSNVIQGSAAAEVIYGFDPAANSASIHATKIAALPSVPPTYSFTPLAVAAAPDDPDHLFVLERRGIIKTLDLATGNFLETSLLDVSSEVPRTGEQGVLGFTFDPDYMNNGYFYVYMSVKNPDDPDAGGDVEIRRYTMSDTDPLVADTDSMKLIKKIDFPADDTHHRGGWIGFGPDGYLYVTVGDGGNGNNAQRLANPLGKILRLDVNGDDFPDDPNQNYAVPADNPTMIDGLAGNAAGTGIYAAGLRNPWKASFDRATGEFYISDVGEKKAEEINLGEAGANYGWSKTEGYFDGEVYPDFTNPIHAYGRDVGTVILGGYVYHGQEDGLHGRYIFADSYKHKVFMMDDADGTRAVSDVTADVTDDFRGFRSPATFGEDALGNLYVATFTGDLVRLNPQGTSSDQADMLDGGGGDDVIYAGAGDDTLLGQTGNDDLNGMAGNDVLDGGVGRDRMAGGLGDDRYTVDDPNDLVLEKANEGKDTIRTKISYVLRDHMSIEILWTTNTAGTGAINLTGNRFDNQISGNAGKNVLAGNGGNDIIRGLAGDDLLKGGVGNDDLRGDEGNDRVEGEAGNDTLEGGAGRDELTGGAGADTFLWRAAETGTFAVSADFVADFNRAEGDRINLFHIDAREDRDGAQAFTFIGSEEFTRAGQVRCVIEGGETLIYLNTDLDMEAEGLIRLSGAHALQADSFVL